MSRLLSSFRSSVGSLASSRWAVQGPDGVESELELVDAAEQPRTWSRPADG